MFSPNSTLSLHPPQIQPRPPADTQMQNELFRLQCMCYFVIMYIFSAYLGLIMLTSFPSFGVITATVIEVSQTAVLGQCIHNSSRTYGMYKSRFFGCFKKIKNKNVDSNKVLDSTNRLPETKYGDYDDLKADTFLGGNI